MKWKSKPIKSGSILFLKFVILLISFLILSFMVFFPPNEGRAVNLSLIEIYKDPFIIYVYISFIPFFIALYNAFKLLNFFDKNKIFTKPAVKTVINIKYSILSFIFFIALALAFVFINSRMTHDDGTGAIMMGMIILFISSIIATGAAVFEKLIQNGMDIKSENDLTI